MRDVRQLFFTHEDVLAAVIYFRERNGPAIPVARSTEIALMVDNHAVSTVITLRDFDRDSRIIIIDPIEMMATLLNYSFYRNCALPKDGDRRLEVIDDELVLTFHSPIKA